MGAASAQDAVPERIDTKLEWVREAAGARLPVVELRAWLRYAQVTRDARAVAEPLTVTFAAGLGEVLASPIVLVGTVEEIVERLHERRERWGYSYFTIQHPVAREFAAVVAALAV